MRPRQHTTETFWAQTAPDGECIIWTGWTNEQGYGRLSWDNRKVYAHRLAFYLRLGRWPESELRHLCNRPECVLHAVEGTRSENEMDKVRAGTHHQTRKTHCPQGHPYDDANTNRSGARICKTCQRKRKREAWRRKHGKGNWRITDEGDAA